MAVDKTGTWNIPEHSGAVIPEHNEKLRDKKKKKKKNRMK